MYMSCMAHNSRKECDQMIQSHTNQASKPRSPLSVEGLWGQPIKLIQVVFPSEFNEY